MTTNRNIPEEVKQQAREQAGGRCYICGERKSHWRPFEYDHIHPASLGGSNKISNIQYICAKCNRRKSDKEFTKTLQWQLGEMTAKDKRYPAIKFSNAEHGRDMSTKPTPTTRFRIR